MDELNDCCKMVEQVKDREIARAVSAVQQSFEVEAERYEARIYELEKLAFDKARAVSALEGEIAGLKHQLSLMSNADVHVKMPPLRTTQVVVTPVPPPPPKTCVVCGRVCSSMCPECKTPVCWRSECGRTHGHGEMYK